jgi:hypothetical protein
MTGPLSFYLSGLSNSPVMTTSATISGADTSPLSGDASAHIDVSLNDIAEFFQFASVTDTAVNETLAIEDLSFKTVYATGDLSQVSYSPGLAVVNSGNEVDPESVTHNTVSFDFVRYLARKLFGTPMGEGLFDNVLDLVNNINLKSWQALDAQLVSASGELIMNGTTDAANNQNLSYILLNQIVKNYPDRLANITYFSTTPEDPGSLGQDGSVQYWYKVPVAQGDSIYFLATISPATNQESLTNIASGSIGTKSFLVKMNIV